MSFLFLAGNKPPRFTDEMPENISVISADTRGFFLNLTKYVKDDQDSPFNMSFFVDTDINTTDYSLSKLDGFKKLTKFYKHMRILHLYSHTRSGAQDKINL